MSASDIYDRITEALQDGRPVDAENLCREYLQTFPDDINAMLLLGLSLQRQGRVQEAITPYSRLTKLRPNDVLHWANYATALRLAGDLHGAEVAARTAVRLAPDDPQQLEQLGLLQLRLGEPLQARGTLLRAFGRASESPAVRIHAAQACAACRDDRAGNLLQPWREWLPLEAPLQFELADLMAQMGEVEEALELLEDLSGRFSDLPAKLLLASTYERVNRLEDAEKLLSDVVDAGACTDANVRREVHRQLAQLENRKHNFAAAKALLEQAGPRDDFDYPYWFALAKTCDRAGDITATMAALENAHTRQTKEFRVATPHLFEPGAELLPRVAARVTEGDYRGWPTLKSPDASQSPVFVVGFPRSGTTLLEQMLDAHPCLQSMDERPFFNILANQLDDIGVEVPKDIGRLNQRDCDELRKGYLLLACSKVPRRWNARLVDKNPLNMLWLPLIHRMYPDARFILALRHPCDVLLSCYMQNFRSAVLAVACQSLEHLARAYVAAMENWLHHVKLFKPDVYVSRYEDLVVDTHDQTRRIAAFLGLQDADAMLGFARRAREKGYIKTPSYTQVIEPINARAVGRWRRYREHFESVLPILAPMIEHWDYSPKQSAAEVH